MSKWGINDKKYIESVEAKKKPDSTKEAQLDSYNLKNLQQEIMLLNAQRANGSINFKKTVQSKTAEKTYHYAKPNCLKRASSEYVIEKNGKK